jgi:hypothetical protein
MTFTVFNGELGEEGKVFISVTTTNKLEYLTIDLTKTSALRTAYENLNTLMNNGMIFIVENYSTDIEFSIVTIKDLSIDSFTLDYTTMSEKDKKVVNNFKDKVLNIIKQNNHVNR